MFEHFQQFFPGCDLQAKISIMNINSPWEATNTTLPSKHYHNFYPGDMKGKNVYDCMAAATPEIATKRDEVSRHLGELRRLAPSTRTTRMEATTGNPGGQGLDAGIATTGIDAACPT